MLSGILTEKPLRLFEAAFYFLGTLLQLLHLPSAGIIKMLYGISFFKKCCMVKKKSDTGSA
jgi:hypothetical protein